MAESIITIKHALHLIFKKYKIKLMPCIFNSAISQNILSNEFIIDLLIERNNIKSLNQDTKDIKLINFHKLNEYYKKGYFIFKKLDGSKHYAVSNLDIIKEKKLDDKKNISIYFIKQQDLVYLLENNFQKENTYWSINNLLEKSATSSAKDIDYGKMICGSAIIFFSTFLLFFNAFNVINNLSYLLQNILKMTLFKCSLASNTKSSIVHINEELPIYSILIPLYNEAFKVKSILSAMESMNYPKNKLDIKIIIEADDSITARTLSVENLPSYIHIIKVPYSLPRTKPKALNYAMSYVKGDILTIYDAEDVPDPDQLLKAVEAFNNLPKNFVCVQAKLNFYNANENLLTRFFSLEYSVWFEHLLKGLSLLNLPVTLGGTSNHFKVEKLKEIGYWDAYNVTEDADLGIRLYLSGYKVHLIDSITMEECPANIRVWLSQRSRWIKGFIQTIYVFLKTKKDLKKLNYMQILTVYIFVGLSTYSFFSLPWILLSLCFELNKYIHYSWFINSIFAFLYLYIIAYFVLIKDKGTIKNLNAMNLITFISWPLYFLLHTIASYIAIWEIIISPFKWNKTPHGKNSDLI